MSDQFEKCLKKGSESPMIQKRPLKPPVRSCLLLLSHPACLFHNFLRRSHRDLKHGTVLCGMR
jgi:hypothetical protein